jgi:hypothetical protein
MKMGVPETMAWIGAFLWQIALLVGLALLVAAYLAPFEVLGWWSGWSERDLEPSKIDLGRAVCMPHDAGYFMVYLTGVHGFEKGPGAQKELDLANDIAARLPDEAIVVADVFPYSVSNNPLNGERLFAFLWRWIDRNRQRIDSSVNLYNVIIATRNVFQVAVSADKRYGPVSNAGVAREITMSLLRHGYPPGSGKPIHIIGYSGGGQIGVGAARYLHTALAAPIHIVSLGGFFTDDTSIAYVDRVDALQGSRDPLPWLGRVLYSGRWPIFPHTQWNRARRHGRIRFIPCGPMTHFGDGDYFSTASWLDGGRTYADHVAEMAASVIAVHQEQGLKESRDNGRRTLNAMA